jgi:hypothetical protein
VSYDAWPSPESQRGPLPRIEDLPIADQGYDQEAVREAFDSFYRHAAQLDSSLKALEAVEVFRREAGELRADLRSLRSLGFGGEPSWAPSYQVERPPREIPSAVPRVAAEACLVIAVAVIAGVAGFRPLTIVALMVAAWAIVVIIEWLAARSRVRLAQPPPAWYAEPEDEPAPHVEAPADTGVGWSAFEAAVADEAAFADEPAVVDEPAVADEPAEHPEGEHTMVGGADSGEPAPGKAADDAEATPGPEPEPAAATAEPEEIDAEPSPEAEDAEPESGQPRKRGLFRRRRATPEAEPAEPEPAEREPPEPIAVPEPPSHVRVLNADDPWERGFDGDDDAHPSPDAEPEQARTGRDRLRRR